MQTWHLQYHHGRDECEVRLEEVPWWALAVHSAVDFVDAATGHHLCGSQALRRPFDWAFFADDRHARPVLAFPVPADHPVVLACYGGDE